jgi:hypothetical protein
MRSWREENLGGAGKIKGGQKAAAGGEIYKLKKCPVEVLTIAEKIVRY